MASSKKDARTKLDLVAEIGRAKPGSVVTLPADTITLTKTLVLSGKLTLRGSGKRKSVVEASGLNAVLEIKGEVTLDNLVVRRAGSKPGDVIVVSGGHAKLVDCEISGAKAKEGSLEGAGLLVSGTAKADAKECRFTGNVIGFYAIGKSRVSVDACECIENSKHGGCIEKNAHGEIAGSRFTKNGELGLAFADDAAGEVHDCECNENAIGLYFGDRARIESSSCRCSGNSRSGVWVREKAVAVLDETVCRNNEEDGISVFEGGKATISGGACEKNKRHGINVCDQAQSEIDGAIASSNKDIGIQFWAKTRGSVSNSSCSNNALGILISDDAEATLEKNECVKNRTHGICFFANARGSARDNRCVGNTKYGLATRGDAEAKLENNLAEANGFSGIAVEGTSRASVNRNQSRKNKVHGIAVIEDASGSFESNECTDNGVCGLRIAGKAKATLRNNTATRNEDHGVLVDEKAEATLEANRFEKNRGSGIVAWDDAKVVARSNTCNGNTYYGLRLALRARLELEDNIADQNGEAGMCWEDKTTGAARRNQCNRNEGSGIRLIDTASPALVGNTCHENGHAGIVVSNQAKPELRENSCEKNDEAGILFDSESSGVAANNVCADNRGDGIRVDDEACPRLERNVCRKNLGAGVHVRGDAEPVIVEHSGDGNRAGEIVYVGGPAPVELVNEKLAGHVLCSHIRRAWLPEVEDRDGAPNGSKFSGAAWLTSGAAWPTCGHCNKPMPLFLQLHLDELPEEARFGSGLLQLFFCMNAKKDCTDHDGHRLVRIIDPRGGSASPPPKGAPAAKAIIGWQPFAELPNWHEAKVLKLKGLRPTLQKLGFSYYDGNDEDEVGPSLDAHSTDKLGGWPAWIQDREVPRCPDCRAEMTVQIFQLVSDSNVPWGWGDVGSAHLLACPAHPNRVELVWQSH